MQKETIPTRYSALNAEQEIALAKEMRAAEDSARAEIETLPISVQIFGRSARRSFKTRSIKISRLEEALTACENCDELNTKQRRCVRRARAQMKHAETLRWKLAMSAQFLPRMEAARLSNPLMGREDLAQYGFLGLLDAAKRFDPERGIRFTSYARWWVRAQMTRAIEQGGRSVRLPGGAVEQIRRLRSISAELESVGLTATTELMAEESGLSERRVRFLLSRGDAISLDDNGGEGLSLSERIPEDDPRGDVDERLAIAEMLERLSGVFDDILNEREKYIIRHHFGLDGLESRSMTSIGASLSLSRERIRQLEVRAFRNLREAI
jgi:RNA polymerase primary sigma factor